MESPNWVMLVYFGSTFQYKIHQERRQISESVNTTSSNYHGDSNDAFDSSQSVAVCNTAQSISKCK